MPGNGPTRSSGRLPRCRWLPRNEPLAGSSLPFPALTGLSGAGKGSTGQDAGKEGTVRALWETFGERLNPAG